MAACVNFTGEESLNYLCLLDGAIGELVKMDATKTEVRCEESPSLEPDLSSWRETTIIKGGFRASHKYEPYRVAGWQFWRRQILC